MTIERLGSSDYCESIANYRQRFLRDPRLTASETVLAKVGVGFLPSAKQFCGCVENQALSQNTGNSTLRIDGGHDAECFYTELTALPAFVSHIPRQCG